MRSGRYVYSLAGVGGFTAGVFVVDLLTPTGIEIWVLYLPVVLFPVLYHNARQVILASALCSVLIGICYFLTPPGANPDWWDLLNRGMGVLAVWLTGAAGVAICRQSARVDFAVASLQREVEARRTAENLMSELEERWRLAMQGGGLGTRDVNLRTGEEFWSDTQFWILGYEPSPTGEASSDMWVSRTHPDDRRRVLAAKEEARRTHSLYHLEYRICRPDREAPAWVEVLGRHHYDETGTAVRFVGVCFDITRRKDLERELLEITARQQQDIGQELHDSVGQELTGLGLIAQTLAQRLPDRSPERGIATRLVGGLDRVHRNVRELSRGIMPVHLDAGGLSAALADLAAKMTEQSGVAVTSECPEWVDLPDHTTATQMFRIAQEAVTNALRHGRPRQIRVTLLAEPNDLRLRIKDDGIGLPGETERGDGLGLRIMKYRAGLIGGTLQIGAAEAGGTVVTLTLPWSKKNGDEEPG